MADGGEDSLSERDVDKDNINLAGFLFGNINEKGQLEDNEILDEESQRHLGQLASLGALGSLVDDIATDQSSDHYHDERESGSLSSDGWIRKTETAVDYSNIEELADEEEEKLYQRGLQAAMRMEKRREDDDYDTDDVGNSMYVHRNQYGGHGAVRPATTAPMHLPSVAPKAETSELRETERIADLFSPSSPSERISRQQHSQQFQDQQKPSESVPDSSVMRTEAAPVRDDTNQMTSQAKSDAQLQSGVLVPGGLLRTSDGKTVTEIFPEFRPGKVLRFSRLFGPKKYVSAQWRGLRKKKKKKKMTSLDGDNIPIQRGFRSKTPPLPRPEDCASDDEFKMLQPIPIERYAPAHMVKLRRKSEAKEESKQKEEGNCEWRYGPAAYWYERYGVNPDGSEFDYGFKLINQEQTEADTQSEAMNIDSPSDECFNMVVQVPWEEDIVWNSEDYQISKQSLIAQSRAGWIPSGNIRTIQAYLTNICEKADKTSAHALASSAIMKNFQPGNDVFLNKNPRSYELSNFYSLFPVENEELVYGKWEDKIIWDDQAMSKIPSPIVFRLDPNDENLILNMPEEPDPSEAQSEIETTPKKDAKSKSKFANKQKAEEEKKEVPQRRGPPKDMFNLSNDEYYMPKQDLAENPLQIDLSSLTIQHSTPALELQRPFFPTYLSPNDLRHFHRFQMTRKKIGSLSKPGAQIVHSLHKQIRKKAKEREKERQAFGGGEMFFMRTPEDLTGMDGDMILVEYCEEYPPILSQPGMNSRIRNYYKRKHGKDSGSPQMEYGETVYVHHSPFLGTLAPGQLIQTLENNMYRTPIYLHNMLTSDFLLIRTSQSYHIRKIRKIFTAGQLCPKYEVPGPNSKRANNHMRDFLQIFIYRLFWKSPDNPRRIKMEDIRKAFPKHSESSIRKRLKLCADFRRTGADCNWWVLKSEFRLPTEEEMRTMVTPEQTCAYYSMLAAEQRLKDAGYGEKSLFAPPDDDDNEDDARKIDDEVQTAPWNTTRAFIQAMKGKCLLQVNGVADPTGCGEGFSYIRVPNKPPVGVKQEQETKEMQQKKQKLVTGTDADLRRLNLKSARNLLRDFGVTEAEINALSRWEVIDKVRTMSTEAARSGEEGGMSKFARGSRFTVAEHQERYKDECQRIFDLQNRVLSSDTVLSTDEESSGEEASDLDELGKDLESMLSNKKSTHDLSHENEEAERRELRKLLSQEKDKAQLQQQQQQPLAPPPPPSNSRPPSTTPLLTGTKRQDDDDTNSVMSLESSSVGRRLLIHRTFKEGDQEYNRTEVVKQQAVIDAYLRIVTRDKNYRQVFASQDEQHKEDMRRERRRIQEQLRRIKRNQEKEKLRDVKKSSKTPSDKPLKNLKCGACGGIGHMKTNKMCPKYSESVAPSVHVARTDEELVNEEMSNLAQEDLIKVEGTKITLGKALLEAAQDIKRKALMIRIPKETVKKKRRPSNAPVHPDYLHRHHMSKNRRRTNPAVALSLIFEGIISKLKEIPESWPFHTPVSTKSVPDYHHVVKNPMDLQSIRENAKNGRFHTREEFLDHVTQIHSNCVLYNGLKHQLTGVAQEMLQLASKLIQECSVIVQNPNLETANATLCLHKEIKDNIHDIVPVLRQKSVQAKMKDEEISQLEREINPLLDDDPQIGLSWLFETIVAQLKAIPDSWPFHIPVSSKIVPDYSDIVKTPMDLETLKQNCQDNRYQSREQFLNDIGLLYSNSLLYNGPTHAFTKTALKMNNITKALFKEHEEHLTHLETEIANREGYPVDTREEDECFTDGPDFAHSEDTIMPDSFPSTAKQVITKADEDEDVDILGMESEESHLNQSSELIKLEQEDSTDQGKDDLEMLLLDLQHSDEEDDREDESDNDFPLDDGDDEDYEMEDVEEDDLKNSSLSQSFDRSFEVSEVDVIKKEDDDFT